MTIHDLIKKYGTRTILTITTECKFDVIEQMGQA